MKSFKYLALGVTSLAVVTSPIWYTPSSEASSIKSVKSQVATSDLQKAKNAVTNYIHAAEKQDVNEMMKWVKDTRFNSIEEQKREYKQMFQNDPFEKIKITGIKKVDDKNMIVSLKMIRKDNGKPQSLDLPVIKENGKWKLLITGVETKE